MFKVHIIKKINRVPVVERRKDKFDRSWEPKFEHIVDLLPSLVSHQVFLREHPYHSNGC